MTTLNPVDEVLNTKNLNTEGSIVAKDWHELKMMSKDFFNLSEGMNIAELENAKKCFDLAYLSFEFPDTMIGNIQREVEGPIIFRMVGKLYMDRLAELEGLNV